MKSNVRRKIASMFLIFLLLLINNVATFSHSGRTDSNGGHRDTKNKSGLGSYHYHCGGYPAHLHKNGICPYKTSSAAIKSTTSSSLKKMSQKEMNKIIQARLNELGYDCGKVDGSIGPKTKAAIKAFQRDHGLKVDGSAGPNTRKAMGLNF